MSKLKETKKPNPTLDEAEERQESESRSSLDRLADFTRRIIAVPKSDVSTDLPAKGARSG